MIYDEATKARFWSKVRKGDGCWDWTGATDRGGYGVFQAGRVAHKAHRVAWAIDHGRRPDAGRFVMHKCDNRRCVRPHHLSTGTHRDNMRDMVAKSRQAKGSRHAWALHPERVARGDRNGSRLHPERLRRGVDVNTAKLSESDVLAIRRGLSDGETKSSLARRFGVSRFCIYCVATGRSWRHVS